MGSELNELLKEYSTENAEISSDNKKTILIVDDDVRIGASLSKIFADEYIVIIALSGQEALDIVSQDVYCIIMDAKMEGMNGFETTKAIKKYHPNIPVIMHTAYHSEHTTAKVVDCHFYGYIEKGNINVRDLKLQVKQACESYKLILENENYRRSLLNKVNELDRAYATLKLQRQKEKKLERVMTGGFAHEIRNALTGGAFELSAILQDESNISAIEKIKIDLTKILEFIFYVESKYSVPREKVSEIASSSFFQINEHLKRLDKTLQALNHDIGRGLYLAKQVLDYSKLQNLKRGTESINITDLINDILEKNKFREKDIDQELIINLEKGENLLIGDSNQIESIIQNIILNAYDAVRGSAIKNIQIKLRTLIKNGIKYLNIDINDSGHGIAKEHLEYLFDPFFTKKYSSGTGLGLSVAKRIAELYEGTIEVESVLGKGARFKLYLKCE